MGQMLCDACQEEADAAELQRLQAQEAARRAERVTEQAGLPKGLRDLRFEDLDGSEGRGEAILAAQAWSQQGGGMFLTGPHGTGKTRLAATAAWAYASRAQALTWLSAPRFAAGLMADFADPAHAAAMGAIGRPGALVLDDLGRQAASDTFVQALEALLNPRMDAGEPVLITSNLRPSELAELYGPWLASRIAGYCHGIVLGGPDRRLRA